MLRAPNHGLRASATVTMGGSLIPLISPDIGMIGYPIFNSSGLLEVLVPGGAWRTRVSLVPPGVLQIGSR